MFLLTRLLPVLIGAMAVVTLEYGLSQPADYISTESLGLLLLFLGNLVLLRRSSNEERLMLLAPPFLFYASSTFSLYFLSSWFPHVVVGVVGFFLWLYGEEIYRYAYEPARYHHHAIEHLVGLLGIMAVAETMAGIFALRIFLNIRLIYLLPLTFVIATTLSASILALQPLSRTSLWSSAVFFGILVSELTLVANFLPTDYRVNSLIVTIPLYSTLHLIRHDLNGTLTTDLVRRYLGLGAVALFLVLVTAQWVV